MTETVDRLAGGERTLAALDPATEPWLEELVPDAAIVDPESPIAFDDLIAQIRSEPAGGRRRGDALRVAGILAGLLLLAAAWRWTALGDWLDPERITQWTSGVRPSPSTLLVAVSVFVVASLLMVPVTLLCAVTALGFGAWLGSACSIVASLVSALAMTPGIVVISVLATSAGTTIREPTPGRVAWVVALAIAFLGTVIAVRRALLRRQGSESGVR